MWQDLSQSELGLNQQLSEFYDTLLSTWHAQLQWSSQVRNTAALAASMLIYKIASQQISQKYCKIPKLLPPQQVFKNPYEVVTVLLIQTLGAMVPSIAVCLSTAMERAAQEQHLDTLLELHQTTSTFGNNLEATMLPHLGALQCREYKDKAKTNKVCWSKVW